MRDKLSMRPTSSYFDVKEAEKRIRDFEVSQREYDYRMAVTWTEMAERHAR